MDQTQFFYQGQISQKSNQQELIYIYIYNKTSETEHQIETICYKQDNSCGFLLIISPCVIIGIWRGDPYSIDLKVSGTRMPLPNA